jgi:hypothetical protein
MGLFAELANAVTAFKSKARRAGKTIIVVR